MYLGLDLGTSNSAIVGNDGSSLKLFKTPEGTDVLPSAIMMDRRGGMLVGKRAYDQAAFSPENVAQGFKRLMGTSSQITFTGSERTMRPEEASAEILKTLIAQARMAVGDFTIEGAVVTVPAAFNQMQTEATMRAAEAAGLPKVALLQEPIAAALASIASSSSKSGQFLVYDLGGGTFDVALVQSISGAATIIGHSGINMLGGRDFDRALVNSIVRPWLFKNFNLPDDFQKHPEYQRLIRVAQYRAELAKIALSTQHVDRIFADESQIGAKDEKGSELYLDIEVTRADLDALVDSEIERTIDHSRRLISENGYRFEDIDRVVMIGGPSRMPIVRQKVESALGIRVDLQTDPMTAVAYGAAIYAEGRDWSTSEVSTKRSRGQTVSQGKVELKLDYPARTSEDKARIRAKVSNIDSVRGGRIKAETDTGWTSGLIDLEAQTDIRDVPLHKGENRIRVTIFDALGVPEKDALQEFVIQRSEATSSGMPLMHSIAIKIVTGAIGAEINELATLVEKGTALPKSGVERFRSAKDLRHGQDDSIEIALFEQAEGVRDPDLNLPIGVFRLSASVLERGDVIRRGEDIFIQWTIDVNGLLNCRIEVPSISSTFDAGKMYVPSAGHKSFNGDGGFRIATGALEAAQGDVDALERALGASVSREVTEFRKRIASNAETLRLSNEADTSRSVAEEARLIRQDVARIKTKPENLARVARLELDEQVEFFALHVSKQVDEKIAHQVHRLAGMARDSLGRNTDHATQDALRSMKEINELTRIELFKIPSFWVAVFEGYADNGHKAIDTALHAKLVKAGEAAIARNDVDGLRSVVADLAENQPTGSDPGKVGVLAGLMR
jgi:molecular chaperone DnaK